MCEGNVQKQIATNAASKWRIGEAEGGGKTRCYLQTNVGRKLSLVIRRMPIWKQIVSKTISFQSFEGIFDPRETITSMICGWAGNRGRLYNSASKEDSLFTYHRWTADNHHHVMGIKTKGTNFRALTCIHCTHGRIIRNSCILVYHVRKVPGCQWSVCATLYKTNRLQNKF